MFAIFSSFSFDDRRWVEMNGRSKLIENEGKSGQSWTKADNLFQLD